MTKDQKELVDFLMKEHELADAEARQFFEQEGLGLPAPHPKELKPGLAVAMLAMKSFDIDVAAVLVRINIILEDSKDILKALKKITKTS